MLSVLLLVAALAGCDSNDSSGSDAGPATRESVTVVAQNLLHGFACAADSERCKLGERVKLFARRLNEAGCPEVVSIEESDPVMVGLLGAVMLNPYAIPKFCGGKYHMVGGGDPGSDREVILTTLPVLGQERVSLAGPLRDALWVRLRAALGPLDVVATHLASGSDDRPCDSETCTPSCRPDDMLKTCQARQAADILDDHSTPESVGVLVGDLNAKPGDPTIEALTARGYVDTYVAAKRPPCDPATGLGCTSGRQDADLSDLTNPNSHQAERIDYVFLATKRDCSLQKPTGLFAEAAAQPPLEGLVFASDHTGVQAKISCRTNAADLAAAKKVAAKSTTTTTQAPAVDAATKAAVTKAFETVFNGGGGTTVESRLTALQGADQLRDSFIARSEDPAVKPLADRVRARIDSIEGVDTTNVNVVYSILLDEAVVLDHLPGAAVRDGDQWLVTRRTYCQVATLGQKTVPEPCR